MLRVSRGLPRRSPPVHSGSLGTDMAGGKPHPSIRSMRIIPFTHSLSRNMSSARPFSFAASFTPQQRKPVNPESLTADEFFEFIKPTASRSRAASAAKATGYLIPSAVMPAKSDDHVPVESLVNAFFPYIPMQPELASLPGPRVYEALMPRAHPSSRDLQQTSPRTVMLTGRLRGSYVADVDAGYIEWLTRADYIRSKPMVLRNFGLMGHIESLTPYAQAHLRACPLVFPSYASKRPVLWYTPRALATPSGFRALLRNEVVKRISAIDYAAKDSSRDPAYVHSVMCGGSSNGILMLHIATLAHIAHLRQRYGTAPSAAAYPPPAYAAMPAPRHPGCAPAEVDAVMQEALDWQRGLIQTDVDVDVNELFRVSDFPNVPKASTSASSDAAAAPAPAPPPVDGRGRKKKAAKSVVSSEQLEQLDQSELYATLLELYVDGGDVHERDVGVYLYGMHKVFKSASGGVAAVAPACYFFTTAARQLSPVASVLRLPPGASSTAQARLQMFSGVNEFKDRFVETLVPLAAPTPLMAFMSHARLSPEQRVAIEVYRPVPETLPGNMVFMGVSVINSTKFPEHHNLYEIGAVDGLGREFHVSFVPKVAADAHIGSKASSGTFVQHVRAMANDTPASGAVAAFVSWLFNPALGRPRVELEPVDPVDHHLRDTAAGLDFLYTDNGSAALDSPERVVRKSLPRASVELDAVSFQDASRSMKASIRKRSQPESYRAPDSAYAPRSEDRVTRLAGLLPPLDGLSGRGGVAGMWDALVLGGEEHVVRWTEEGGLVLADDPNVAVTVEGERETLPMLGSSAAFPEVHAPPGHYTAEDAAAEVADWVAAAALPSAPASLAPPRPLIELPYVPPQRSVDAAYTSSAPTTSFDASPRPAAPLPPHLLPDPSFKPFVIEPAPEATPTIIVGVEAGSTTLPALDRLLRQLGAAPHTPQLKRLKALITCNFERFSILSQAHPELYAGALRHLFFESGLFYIDIVDVIRRVAGVGRPPEFLSWVHSTLLGHLLNVDHPLIVDDALVNAHLTRLIFLQDSEASALLRAELDRQHRQIYSHWKAKRAEKQFPQYDLLGRTQFSSQEEFTAFAREAAAKDHARLGEEWMAETRATMAPPSAIDHAEKLKPLVDAAVERLGGQEYEDLRNKELAAMERLVKGQKTAKNSGLETYKAIQDAVGKSKDKTRKARATKVSQDK